MRTIEIKIFKFDELSSEAKGHAVEQLSDINVSDMIWWEFICDDAKDIGLDIVEFDLYSNRYKIKPIYDFSKIKELILKNHGKETETYKIAHQCDLRNFNQKHNMIQGLKKAYIKMLDNEYEYLTGEPAIIETIKANDYEFYENGKLYSPQS